MVQSPTPYDLDYRLATSHPLQTTTDKRQQTDRRYCAIDALKQSETSLKDKLKSSSERELGKTNSRKQRGIDRELSCERGLAVLWI